MEVDIASEMSVAYSRTCQKSMAKLLRKNNTVKSFIIDIWQSSKYASVLWMSEKTHFLKALKYNKQVEGWYLY